MTLGVASQRLEVVAELAACGSVVALAVVEPSASWARTCSRSRWWSPWASASLEVVGFALAECLELHALAVEPRRPRGRVVGLERWSTGPGNVAALGGLVALEVVGLGLVVLEHAQPRALGLGTGEVAA